MDVAVDPELTNKTIYSAKQPATGSH